jgi:integrase
MKSPVQLYLRVRLPDGTYPYLKASYAANGRLRPHYAVHAGRATEFPGSVYYLRYRQNGKRTWDPIGSDSSLALVRFQQKALELQSSGDGQCETSAIQPVAEQAVPPTISRLLNASISEYLKETEAHRSAKTFAAYRKTLHSFSPESDPTGKSKKFNRQFADQSLDRITRADVLTFIEFLKSQGNSPRTIRNRVDFLQIFLHHFGVSSILKGKDLPRYTEKRVRAYSEPQLSTLFSHATQDESDLLYFFLCTGAREREAQFVCWSDVDLDRKEYTVTEHLDLGYRPKDKEEGTVPIPDVLVTVLKARRDRSPNTRLIFPGKGGQPNGHLLRIVKRLALKAGLNCGICINKKGKSCASQPVCKQFVLHKLRKTFATTLHHQGLPAQTLQRYLRHSDLDTTIKYIADADDAVVRKTINNTFRGFTAPAGGAE